MAVKRLKQTVILCRADDPVPGAVLADPDESLLLVSPDPEEPPADDIM